MRHSDIAGALCCKHTLERDIKSHGRLQLLHLENIDWIFLLTLLICASKLDVT